ncbi:MAG TPA: hypothetical protein VHM70_26185 [Polyangiaceae bacterium]|nr:hypothetical protein [Polyangiaceae bacterium]
MNFFGHAVIASWARPDPAFALGAMLPDLGRMLGARHVSSEDPALGAGIAFHHESDRVFHQSRVFAEFERAALAYFRERRVPRGPRRALSHIGVELLLDCHLASKEQVASYLRALNAAGRTDVADRITWRSGSAAHGRDLQSAQLDFQELCRRLASRVERLVPERPRDLTPRLEAILSGHPRLALPGDRGSEVHASVNDWLDMTWPVVEQRLPEWLAELATGLHLKQAIQPELGLPNSEQAA